MKIKQIIPSDCFTGVDKDGWLNYPNVFHCPRCDYGIYFKQPSLEKGWADQQVNPLKLDPAASSAFVAYIREFISNHFERFILDFYCPKCQSPYVIGFESHEFHMAAYRYRPIAVFSAAE
jgi:hypothetical protein